MDSKDGDEESDSDLRVSEFWSRVWWRLERRSSIDACFLSMDESRVSLGLGLGLGFDECSSKSFMVE